MQANSDDITAKADGASTPPAYGPEGRWKQLRAERDEALREVERGNAAIVAQAAEVQRLRSALGDLHRIAAEYSGLAVPLRGEEDLFFAAEERFAAAMNVARAALTDEDRA